MNRNRAGEAPAKPRTKVRHPALQCRLQPLNLR